MSKNVFLFMGFIILLISYIKYNEIIYFSNNSNLNEVNIKDKNLKYINSPLPIEHMVKLTDELLICSGLQYPKIFITKEYLTDKIIDGSLFLYNIKEDKLEPLKIDNFPKSVPFHPHGISLYKINTEKYYLYIINHSIKTDHGNNEERIEKVLLTIDNYKKKNQQLSLSFKNTITLPQNYFGTLNSLAVINLNTIYFTTQNFFPLPSFSKETQNINYYIDIIKLKLFDYLNIDFQKLNLKKTYLYSYNWDNGKITLIQNSEGLSNHGLAYNPEKLILYMASSHEKEIKIFEISRNDPTKALLIGSIKTIYNVGNIFYDGEKDKLYAGIYGSISELINLGNNYIKNGDFEDVTTFGGFEEIDIKNNYDISDIILMKNEIKGVSSAIKINNAIYLSSPYQAFLLIYQRKNTP